MDGRLSLNQPEVERIQKLVGLNTDWLKDFEPVLVDCFPAKLCDSDDWGFVVIVSQMPDLMRDPVPPELADPGGLLRPCRFHLINQMVYHRARFVSLAEPDAAHRADDAERETPALSASTVTAATRFFEIVKNDCVRYAGIVCVRPSTYLLSSASSLEPTRKECVLVTVKAKGWCAWGSDTLPLHVAVDGVTVPIKTIEGQFQFSGNARSLLSWPTGTDRRLKIGSGIERSEEPTGKGSVGMFGKVDGVVGIMTAAHVALGSPWEYNQTDTPLVRTMTMRHPGASTDIVGGPLASSTSTKFFKAAPVAGSKYFRSGTLAGIMFPQRGGGHRGDAAFVPLTDQGAFDVKLAASYQALQLSYENQFRRIDDDLDVSVNHLDPFPMPCFCEQSQPAKTGDFVLMLGNKSGLTIGRSVGVGHIVADLSNGAKMYLANGDELRRRMPSLENNGVITLEDMGIVEPKKLFFSANGDSGALVWKYRDGVHGHPVSSTFSKTGPHQNNTTYPAIPLGLICGQFEEKEGGRKSVFTPLDRFRVMGVDIITDPHCE